MTTRTIREADINIFPTLLGNGYRLMEKAADGAMLLPEHGYRHTNYASALQARADIIDGRAGVPRVGDMVRIGLKGVQTYAVAEVGEDTLGLAYRDAAGTPRTRRVAMDRVHLVEGVR